MPLEQVLDKALKEQGLDYYRTGKTIFVVRKQPEPVAQQQPTDEKVARLIDVNGKVTDTKGEPLIGASVALKNSNKGTFTNEKGLFTLKNVPAQARLEISFTGYQRREIIANDQQTLAVELAVASNVLDETQVIAYGKTTERFSTGNVTTIKGEDIEKQPVQNPLLALEGRVPGIQITPASGVAGAGVTVRIQGQNSLANGSDPLYVVDGVPYNSQLLSGMGQGILGVSGGVVGGLAYGSSSPLNYINPLDIESISVLKDADATAIYGSRAANGAILITTKKGRAGKTKADLNLQQGIGQITRMIHMMDTRQYLQMRREALMNDGVIKPAATDYDLNGIWDSSRNTNWQKQLIGGTAKYTNLNADISGGNANTQFLIGLTYHRETTVFPGDFADQKASAHFNLTNTSIDQKLRLQLSATYQIDQNQLPNADITSTSFQIAPDAPALYNKDGSLNWAPDHSGNTTWANAYGANPVASLYNTYTNHLTNLISNAVVSYHLLPGMEIRSNFGYTSLRQDENILYPLIAIAPENRAFSPRMANYGNSNTNSWIVEPQISYKTQIAGGRIDALIGATIQQNNGTFQELTASGFNSDAVLKNIAAASLIAPIAVTESIYRYNALFGRIGYNWHDKYLLDLTARRDGSSRFGPANEFHNFGAMGIGWIFSQENLIQRNLHWLSFGKLKGSYGTTGNDQIGDYTFLSLYNPVATAINYQGETGLLPVGLPNPYIQWETTRKLQFGVDLGFFRDRILINAVYYRNRSSNQLLSYILPINTGFGSITKNFPATIQNSGFEISFSTINIKTKDFTWTSSFNLSTPRNKLVSFPNLANSTYAGTLVVGEPFMGNVAVYRYAGVNPVTGKYQFYDQKGNLTYTPALTDRNDTIYLPSKFYGGFENKFVYKSIELDILFQFTQQIALNNLFGNLIAGIGGINEPVYLSNRWQNPGDEATHQRYSQNFKLNTQVSNARISNAAYGDASYLRLKNLALSWQFPQLWVSKAHLENSKIFLQAENLLTFTPYKALDPQNQGTLPILRVITLGIRAGF